MSSRKCLKCKKILVHGNQKYCSIVCKRIFYRETQGKYRQKIVKYCRFCEKEFHPHRTSNRFCSQKCAAWGRKGKTVANQLTFICQQCRKEYQRQAKLLGKTSFCSRKCQSISSMKKYKGKNNPNYKDGKSLIKKFGNAGKKRNYKKGRYYENKTRKILEKGGYFVTRSAASKGAADLIAINKDEVILVQVKSGTSFFSPRERNDFIKLVVPGNCKKELWSWQSNRPPVIKKF